MQVHFARSKGDQTGEGMSNVKHVYANPVRPEVCPVLALAVYVFCKQERTSTTVGSKLFEGADQKGRFSDVLQDILELIPAHVDLGCSKDEVGTHSTRKGSATYLLSLIDGPSAIQTYFEQVGV